MNPRKAFIYKGERYNMLTSVSDMYQLKETVCDFLCDCGNKKTISVYKVFKGRIKSCGCLSNVIINKNEKYGNLTAISNTYNSDVDKNKVCDFLCDCGNTKTIKAYAVYSGHYKSCGCLKHKKIHGMADTRIYKSWINIKKRCLNPNDDSYKHYGGRGILICEEWMSFESFYNWAISNGYSDELEIDRENNNGNYEPNNCRYVTRKQNSRNRRLNIYYDGKTLMQILEELNLVDNKTLVKRIHSRIYRKWNLEFCLENFDKTFVANDMKQGRTNPFIPPIKLTCNK